MSMRSAIFNACGREIQKMVPVAGGDICDAYRADLSGGERIFIKCHPRAALLSAEAEGLKWLENSGAKTPEVIASCGPDDLQGFLALEWIDVGSPKLGGWAEFGRMLARLHMMSETEFGWKRDNFLGHLDQKNSKKKSWAVFYRDNRLLPQLKMAVDTNKSGPQLIRKMDPLLRDLENRISEPLKPSRLHGDLWSGNLIFSKSGQAHLIDPAPYAGHREMDLAMMELFGGFHPRCMAAYDESFPLPPGWRERLPIYQLYYLLAHVNLHGESWMTSVWGALNQLT